MKAMIIAAGEGKRLANYSKNKPKTLVEVSGMPILCYILNNLIKEGIKDILIVTGYNGKMIREFVKREYGKLNVDYVHNEDYDKTNNIYSVYLTKSKMINNSFILINSDVLFHSDILKDLKNSSKNGLILSVDLNKNLGEEEMKVRIEEDLIVEISKEIDPKKADGEYIGLTRIDKEMSKLFYQILEETIKDKGTGVFYEEAFQSIINHGYDVYYESTKGLPWIEIDTPEDLRVAMDKVAPNIKN